MSNRVEVDRYDCPRCQCPVYFDIESEPRTRVMCVDPKCGHVWEPTTVVRVGLAWPTAEELAASIEECSKNKLTPIQQFA
jgi:hypothetical protein